MAHQKAVSVGTTSPGEQTLNVNLDLIMTATAGAVISAYTAFNRAFSEAPKIVGLNPATTGGIPSAAADVNGVTIYSYQPSTDAPAATVAVEVTLNGKLADG